MVKTTKEQAKPIKRIVMFQLHQRAIESISIGGNDKLLDIAMDNKGNITLIPFSDETKLDSIDLANTPYLTVNYATQGTQKIATLTGNLNNFPLASSDTLISVSKSETEIQLDLTNLVAELEKINQRADETSQKVTTLEKKADDLETSQNALSNKVSDLDSKQTELTQKVDTLETSQTALSNKVGDLDSKQTDLTQKVDSLETSQTALSNKVGDLDSKQTELTQKVDSLETSQTALSNKVNDVDTKQSELSQKVDTLETSQTALSNKVNDVDTKQAELTQNVLFDEERLSNLETSQNSLSQKVNQLKTTNIVSDDLTIKKTTDNNVDTYHLTSQVIVNKDRTLTVTEFQNGTKKAVEIKGNYIGGKGITVSQNSIYSKLHLLNNNYVTYNENTGALDFNETTKLLNKLAELEKFKSYAMKYFGKYYFMENGNTQDQSLIRVNKLTDKLYDVVIDGIYENMGYTLNLFGASQVFDIKNNNVIFLSQVITENFKNGCEVLRTVGANVELSYLNTDNYIRFKFKNVTSPVVSIRLRMNS